MKKIIISLTAIVLLSSCFGGSDKNKDSTKTNSGIVKEKKINKENSGDIKEDLVEKNNQDEDDRKFIISVGGVVKGMDCKKDSFKEKDGEKLPTYKCYTKSSPNKENDKEKDNSGSVENDNENEIDKDTEKLQEEINSDIDNIINDLDVQ